MDAEMFRYVVKAVAVVSMMATPLAEASIARAAFEAIGRNPKLEETLFSKVIIAIALVESTAIYALVAFFTI
jgi:F0F1-type ATP synthase membrane subunit c/vacuolar-type H+-ATPase subunit K